MQRFAGRFIVLEGADGCGKSTQARRLAEALKATGTPVLHVREPGSTGLGEGVRDLLLDPARGPVGVRAETLLYMAARAQLVEQVVGPALQAGRTVVCERWTLSTEVYQGVAGGLGADVVRSLAEVAEAGVRPDRVLVLDLDDAETLRRLTGEPDRMEAKGDAFHRAVVQGYRTLATDRERHVVIPPGTPDAVAERVLAEVLSVVC